MDDPRITPEITQRCANRYTTNNGAIVAAQPHGAPSWFPCNDHPGIKSTYATTVTCDSPYTVVTNGVLVQRVVRGSRTSWTYEQREPMAPYLASVQIGAYTAARIADAPDVPQTLHVPPRLKAEALHGEQQLRHG